MEKFTVIPELLEIKSNVDYIIHFKFGERLNDKMVQSENNKIRIEFKVTKDFEKPNYLNQKFHFVWGKEGIDELYYECPLIGSFKAKLLIRDLTTSPKIFVNPIYYQWLRFQIEGVYPPGSHLTNITTVKLIEHGYVPLHCSAISYDSEGILIFAPPDTGKTITAFSSLDYGFKFLSEDIAITDGRYIYGCPFTATYRDFANNSWISQIRHSLCSQVPIMGYFIKPTLAKSIFELIGEKKIDKTARIKTIYILDRGKQSLEEMSNKETMRRILILNRYGFDYFKNPLLLAYSNFNEDLDLNRLMEKEKQVISKIVSNSTNYLVKSGEHLEYIDLIRKNFGDFDG